MHRVMFSSSVRKYINVFKSRTVTRRNANERGLVLDDNSLVREALRFVLTHLELHVVCLHQRAIASAPMDDLRSALCAPDCPIADGSEGHLPPVESRELICQVEA